MKTGILVFSAMMVYALLMLPSIGSAEPIEDNSFLLEEAYNQDPGVVQFILQYELQQNHDWGLQYTNEFPLWGKTHQFSYSVPYSHIDQVGGGDGFGDVLFNYRYQLLDDGKIALAPRIGILVPTGDDKKGLGEGGAGLDFNMAASVRLTPKWAMHMNAGFTLTPRSKVGAPPKRTTLENSYGLSGIYHFCDTLDFQLEAKGVGKDLFIAPGIRAAINRGPWQIVPGLAYVRNVRPYADEATYLAYFSVEGPI